MNMSSDDVMTECPAGETFLSACPSLSGLKLPTSRDFLQEQGSFRGIDQASGPRRTVKIVDCFCLYRLDAILGKPLDSSPRAYP
jgi:hypothetical protein